MATGHSHNCSASNCTSCSGGCYEIVRDLSPDDEFYIQKSNIKRWEEHLRSFGVPYKVITSNPYRLNIEVEDDDSEAIKNLKRQRMRDHFYNSSVYVSKFMSELGNTGEALFCNYQGMFLHYKNDAFSEKFYLTNLQGDLNDERARTDTIYTNNMLLENVKGAFLLVQHAKLSGWQSITFGDTTDPLKRLALKMVCDALAMPNNETVDMNAANTATVYGAEIQSYMQDVIYNYEDAPFKIPHFENTTKKEISDDDLFEDLPPVSPPSSLHIN